MSIRTKVLGLVDVMMRVPPILVIDEILKMGMGLPTRFYPDSERSDVQEVADAVVSTGSAVVEAIVNATTGLPAVAPLESLLFNDDGYDTFIEYNDSMIEHAIENASATANAGGLLSSTFGMLMGELSHDRHLANMLTVTSVKFSLCLLGFISSICVFMLWTRHLVMVYMFVISLGLTFLSYWSNVSALAVMAQSPCVLEDLLSLNTTRLLDTGGVAMTLMPHIVAQWFMGMLFAYIHLGPRYALLQKWMPLIFVSPILLAMLPLPPKVIEYLPVAADSIPLLLTKITLLGSAMEACRTVYNGYQYAMNFVTNFGLSALIENEWQRLNVPSVLRVFWTIRIVQGFISMTMTDGIASMELLPTIQKLLVDGCETLTAVLGMTSIISLFSHYIGKVFQWYLIAFDNDDEKSLGTVSAVLFYILAMQTGLTSLTPEKRFARLCRNMCLLTTALLHFLHNIVSPILMSLSAARNPSRKRHIRALTTCAFLVIVPICLLVTLWTRHTPSTWLLAVTAFSIEVIIKVFVTLATYTLFLLDARRQSFWEKLDDYLYYVRAFGNSVEFCFGILLFFNGAWILLFESGGAIRAIMMCIHAYFNIWCEARAGWSVFMKRRSAVHKISALPEATSAQLRAFDDVCAICYQDMYSAKITRCRHFFHGVCLRKWLYVQDRCPLCHEIMMYTDKNDGNEATAAAEAAPPIPIYPRDDDNEPEVRSPEQAAASVAAASTSNTAPSSTSASSSSAAASSSVEGNGSSSNATTPDTSTSAAAAAMATAAAAASSNAHGFRLPDIGVQD